VARWRDILQGHGVALFLRPAGCSAKIDGSWNFLISLLYTRPLRFKQLNNKGDGNG
jgi:hypothetical protein